MTNITRGTYKSRRQPTHQTKPIFVSLSLRCLRKHMRRNAKASVPLQSK